MLYKNLNDEKSSLWNVHDMNEYYIKAKANNCLNDDIENLDDFINNLIDCGDFEMVEGGLENVNK